MPIVDQGSTLGDNLIAGPHELLTKKVTLAANLGAVKRGSILGKILLGAATKANGGPGTAGANTGNGTLTLDTTTPILTGAKPGVYKVRVIRAAVAAVATTPGVPAEKALVELKDPDGNTLEVFELATTPGTTIENQVKFVMVEGSTPFVVTDGFNITIAAGSGQYKVVDSSAVDGSAEADCVLSEDVTVGTSALGATAYKTGMFNLKELIVAEGDTVAAHEEELRLKGIFMKDEVYHS